MNTTARLSAKQIANAIADLWKIAQEVGVTRDEPYCANTICERIAALRTRTAGEGWRDIVDERQRQIEAEGWTPEHDDEYGTGELAVAAAAYVLTACGFRREAALEFWPKKWSRLWLKPTTSRRDLVKAGALIIAEIDRLDRLPAAPKKEG